MRMRLSWSNILLNGSDSEAPKSRHQDPEKHPGAAVFEGLDGLECFGIGLFSGNCCARDGRTPCHYFRTSSIRPERLGLERVSDVTRILMRGGENAVTSRIFRRALSFIHWPIKTIVSGYQS